MNWPFLRIKARDVNWANRRWESLRGEIKKLQKYSEDYCPKIEGHEVKQIGKGWCRVTINAPLHHNKILKKAIDNEITRLDKLLDKLKI